MLKKIILILILCAGIFTGGNGLAVTVNFGDYNLGPSDPLVVDGVTLTNLLGGSPATVQGVGVGINLIGSPGYLDRISHYGAGSNPTYSTQREGLRLQVNGVLNSFTITPYFNENIQLPIEFVYLGGTFNGLRGEVWETVYATGSSYTFTIPFGSVDYTDIQLASYWDEMMYFWEYLRDRGYPETHFQYGFTIASLDYTPNQVPEAGTLSLLCSGLIGVAGLRRRYAKK